MMGETSDFLQANVLLETEVPEIREQIETKLKHKLKAAHALGYTMKRVIDYVFSEQRVAGFQYVHQNKYKKKDGDLLEDVKQILLDPTDGLSKLFRKVYNNEASPGDFKILLDDIQNFLPRHAMRRISYLRAIVDDEAFVKIPRPDEKALLMLTQEKDTNGATIVWSDVTKVVDKEPEYIDLVKAYATEGVFMATELYAKHMLKLHERLQHVFRNVDPTVFEALCTQRKHTRNVVYDSFVRRCKFLVEYAQRVGSVQADQNKRMEVYITILLTPPSTYMNIIFDNTDGLVNADFIVAVSHLPSVDVSALKRLFMMSKDVPLMNTVKKAEAHFGDRTLRVAMAKENTCMFSAAYRDWAWPMFSTWRKIALQNPPLLKLFQQETALTATHGHWSEGICASFNHAFNNANICHVDIWTEPYSHRDPCGINGTYCRGYDTSTTRFDLYVVNPEHIGSVGEIVGEGESHVLKINDIELPIPVPIPLGKVKLIDITQEAHDLTRPSQLDLVRLNQDGTVGSDHLRLENPVLEADNQGRPNNLKRLHEQLQSIQGSLVGAQKTPKQIMLGLFETVLLNNSDAFYETDDAETRDIQDKFIYPTHLEPCFDLLKAASSYLSNTPYSEVHESLQQLDTNIDVETFVDCVLSRHSVVLTLSEQIFNMNTIICNVYNNTSFLYIFLQFLTGFVIGSLQYIRQNPRNGSESGRPAVCEKYKNIVQSYLMSLLKSANAPTVFAAGLQEVIACMVNVSKYTMSDSSPSTFIPVEEFKKEDIENFPSMIVPLVMEMWMKVQVGSDGHYDEAVFYFGGLGTDVFKIIGDDDWHSRVVCNLAHAILGLVSKNGSQCQMWESMDEETQRFLIDQANESMQGESSKVAWKGNNKVEFKGNRWVLTVES